jgi:hypothetical protein
MISYNQQHGTTSMKKYILTKYIAICHRRKTTNITLVTKEQQWEMSKEKSIVDYGVITNHFGSTIRYKEVDAQQLRFFLNLLFVAKVYMPSSIM